MSSFTLAVFSGVLVAFAFVALAAPATDPADDSTPTTTSSTQPASAPAACVVKMEFLYDTAPFPSCHASTIVETTSGKLVTAFFGGTRERDPDVCIWVCREIGDAWTPPKEVANGVQDAGARLPTWNPVLFQPKTAR